MSVQDNPTDPGETEKLALTYQAHAVPSDMVNYLVKSRRAPLIIDGWKRDTSLADITVSDFARIERLSEGAHLTDSPVAYIVHRRTTMSWFDEADMIEIREKIDWCSFALTTVMIAQIDLSSVHE